MASSRSIKTQIKLQLCENHKVKRGIHHHSPRQPLLFSYTFFFIPFIPFPPVPPSQNLDLKFTPFSWSFCFLDFFRISSFFFLFLFCFYSSSSFSMPSSSISSFILLYLHLPFVSPFPHCYPFSSSFFTVSVFSPSSASSSSISTLFRFFPFSFPCDGI